VLMEKDYEELLIQAADTNPLLKKLQDEHLRLDKEVERFGRYAVYSSSAALRQKELKKAKLRTKECIVNILKEYRRGDAAILMTH